MALSAAIAVIVYTPTLKYGLVWDDTNLVVQSQSSPFQAFARSFWHGGGAGVLGDDPYYRPLVNFSLGVDELVAGHRAWYFHLVNILLHAVAVTLVCAAVWLVFNSSLFVIAAGVLYAVNPLAADSVAYVSGRTDLLAAIGLLVAFLGMLRLQKQRGWAATAMIWVGFTIAVFSKETGAVFPAVMGVWVALPGARQVRSRAWVAAIGVLVLLAGYLAARHAALGSIVAMSVGGNVGSWIMLSLSNFGRLLAVCAWPWAQGVFVWQSAGSRWLAWSAAAGVLYMLLPVVLRRATGARQVGLAWFWGLAMLFPFAGLAGFGPVGRLLYVPGIGFVLLLLYLVREVTRGDRRGQAAAAVAMLGYCVLLSLFALPRRMQVWADGYMLFRRMTTEAPGYPAAHFNYAFELRKRGDLVGAVTEYRKAIALDSNMALAYSNLGALLQAKGELTEAESLYAKTISLRPNYALAWNNLAIIRYRRGDGAGAVRAFRRAIELKPDDAGAVYNLGRVYQQAGINDSAAALFERAYQLDPTSPQIRASYYQTSGRRE